MNKKELEKDISSVNSFKYLFEKFIKASMRVEIKQPNKFLILKQESTYKWVKKPNFDSVVYQEMKKELYNKAIPVAKLYHNLNFPLVKGVNPIEKWDLTLGLFGTSLYDFDLVYSKLELIKTKLQNELNQNK